MKIHSYIYRFVGSGTLVGMASALLLSSCQLGKQYVRPDLEMPRTLMQDGMGNDSATIADYSWQQVYTDTLLQSLIYKMLDYNKDLLMAGATIKEQAALKRIVWANMFPQVGLRVYAEKEGTPREQARKLSEKVFAVMSEAGKSYYGRPVAYNEQAENASVLQECACADASNLKKKRRKADKKKNRPSAANVEIGQETTENT